jgi:transposase
MWFLYNWSMRPTGSPETLEARRIIAARLFERGTSLTEVAAVVGSSVSSAHRWRKAWRHGSRLRSKPHPGRAPKLSSHQRSELVAALVRGTRCWGYAPDGWTGPLVRDVIQRLFGVEFHPEYVPRLLHRLGWSPQKPERRARERNEADIARWRRESWPRLKKEPRTSS